MKKLCKSVLAAAAATILATNCARAAQMDLYLKGDGLLESGDYYVKIYDGANVWQYTRAKTLDQWFLGVQPAQSLNNTGSDTFAFSIYDNLTSVEYLAAFVDMHRWCPMISRNNVLGVQTQSGWEFQMTVTAIKAGQIGKELGKRMVCTSNSRVAVALGSVGINTFPIVVYTYRSDKTFSSKMDFYVPIDPADGGPW